ncbi:MAG: Uma2 family endonuclease [Isosphaeraceae bacterium]
MKIKAPRWTTERFKLAAQAGCFHDMKVELIGGRLVEMTESPEHRNTVENLVELFAAVFDKNHWHVARESSVEFDDWTPLPDIAVCRGSRRPRYSHRAPTPEDIVLLAEVSQSTCRYDRRVKLPRYARAGIPLVWIVNLESRAVEVYSKPQGNRYTSCEVLAEGQPARLLAGEPPEVIDASFPVCDLLP